ncbi:MAG: hypothetical protein P1Q69_16395 [Candidatus Thorarchaeota archaeon]|nr:hypothetical protein [Candidatus Thorarchaeota archaeon]
MTTQWTFRVAVLEPTTTTTTTETTDTETTTTTLPPTDSIQLWIIIGLMGVIAILIIYIILQARKK